jgi:hypothetical protein
MVGSRQAEEEEEWALAAAVAAHQEKEVMEVAEDTVCQAVALLQSSSVDVTTVESTAGPFFGPYCTPSTSSPRPTMPPWPRPTWLAWSCHRSSTRRRMT